MSSYRERTVYELIAEGIVPRRGLVRVVFEPPTPSREEAEDAQRTLLALGVVSYIREIVEVAAAIQEAA